MSSKLYKIIATQQFKHEKLTQNKHLFCFHSALIHNFLQPCFLTLLTKLYHLFIKNLEKLFFFTNLILVL